MAQTRTAYRTCPFCEATCGLELTLDGDELIAVRGDADDVFSAGYLCPKGLALVDLERDPAVVRQPMVREEDALRPASWEEAFDRIAHRLQPIIAEHGPDAVAIYLGNPNVHNMSGSIYGRALIRAIGTKNIFSASSVDQLPKQVSSALMFGSGVSVAVPDVDRTMHLLILGANPLASNGSLLTAPDLPGRLRAIRARGGRIVVVDPRRTETARKADEHHFIVPGSDALLLAAIANTIMSTGRQATGRLTEHLIGLDEVTRALEPFTPESVEGPCGIDAEEIRRMAIELAEAERGVVYARIGTTAQEFGMLASWLVDVINVLIGALDEPGGAMFTTPAAAGPTLWGTPGVGRGKQIGRHRSRVRGLPEALGELPSVCLSEEILTPGPGQVRALITIGGNPVVSTPDSAAMQQALDSLELMVSVDIYQNETTRHADVLLPGEPVLQRPHYDLAFMTLACRNIANYSPPIVAMPEGAMPEWEVLLRLAACAVGSEPMGDVEPLDQLVVAETIRKGIQAEASPAFGVEEDAVWKAIAARRGPERVLDVLLRMGPYGDGFGRVPDGLTLAQLEAAPHGVDLGPLVSRIPEMLRTSTGKIELAPEQITVDIPRLADAMGRRRNGGFVLIGRRQLRSNNSWMHTLPLLQGGSNRCTMLIHPDDAANVGIAEGGRARVSSQAGTLDVDATVSDEVMRGVVSIPHGWGSDHGANSNLLARTDLFDAVSGNAVLNGIPVEVAPA